MTQLNQILGVQQGAKSGAERAETNAHHLLQRTDGLAGIARTYRRRHDDGDELPPESTLVQVRTMDVIAEMVAAQVRYYDTVATKDVGNCVAKADVVLDDGTTLLRDVPAVTLLFLEKQLVRLRAFVNKLPTLPPSSTWMRDEATDTWVTEPVETTRTTKVLRNHVLSEGTVEHPPQVQVYTEDVVVGYWSTRKFSGALPVSQVNAMRRRLEELQRAVRFAREKANSTTIEDVKVGEVLTRYLFGL